MTSYVGIDPSVSNTGVAILRDNGTILNCRSFKAQPLEPGYTWQQKINRYQRLARDCIDYLQEYCVHRPVRILIENYAPSRFMNSTIPQIEFGTILREKLMIWSGGAGQWVGIAFVSPAQVKQFATGKGNSNKMLVALSLQKRFNVDFGSDDDLWDAYAIAQIARVGCGNTNGNLTQEQIKIAQKAIGDGLK